MAKSYGHRWNGWRVDLHGTEIKDKPGRNRNHKRREPKGNTNPQARFLANLRRQQRKPDDGNGITCRQASTAIDRVLAEIEGRQEPA
jgi:hypothetical protein